MDNNSKKELEEIQKKYIATTRQLNQIAMSKQVFEQEYVTEKTALDYLENVPEDTTTYKTVGRLFVKTPAKTLKENYSKNIEFCAQEVEKNKKAQILFTEKLQELEKQAQKLTKQ
eukprot:gene4428-7803_t